ncbi:MAG: ATP-binding cassette domain-containing protein [Phenylobacterium sp.]
MAVLKLEAVVKRFAGFTAVDGLSFDVPEGQVFGFLGANGAGKTTTLRMVLDILRPTSGRIEVLGGRPGRKVAPSIGFLPEERGLYRKMTPLQTVTYFGRLKGMAAGEARASASDLIERFGLDAWASQSIDKLSKGMAQKVQLAAALVNRPRLLILDEPFSGLDPVNQAGLEATILEHARSGATVVFSTHVMQHAERLCDRLLLLARGRKVFEGGADEARALLPGRLALTVRGDPRSLPGVRTVRPLGEPADGWSDYDVELAPGADAALVLQACVAQGLPLRRFETRRASLHEVFLQVVGEGLAPAEAAA